MDDSCMQVWLFDPPAARIPNAATHLFAAGAGSAANTTRLPAMGFKRTKTVMGAMLPAYSQVRRRMVCSPAHLLRLLIGKSSAGHVFSLASPGHTNGVAPGCTLHAVKVLGQNGRSGTKDDGTSTIVQGLYWVIRKWEEVRVPRVPHPGLCHPECNRH